MLVLQRDKPWPTKDLGVTPTVTDRDNRYKLLNTPHARDQSPF